MPVFGRRICSRTRDRTGTLSDSDDTLVDDAAPFDPGTPVDGGTNGGIGIDIGVSLGIGGI